MSDLEVIETYRGLWEIEETFRITKGVLETRPVYVSLQEHINAHFLTCFLALTILRIIQKRLGGSYSAERIIECLNRISCSVNVSFLSNLSISTLTTEFETYVIPK